MNLLSFFSTRSFTIIAAEIKNPEAVRLSYPIAKELSDSVGLKSIRMKITYVNFLIFVFNNCDANNKTAHEKIAD